MFFRPGLQRGRIMSDRDDIVDAVVEQQFQSGIRATPWFSEFVGKHGEEPDLNTPHYDYRGAWAAGARPTVRDPGDGMLHWDSRFKGEDHPNRYVDGVDTRGRR